jgi:pentatricopeptide repeat protein
MSVFIDSCGYNNQFDIAIQFWEKMKENYLELMSTNVYTSMIEACGRCGQLLKGKEILNEFQNSNFLLLSSQEEKGKLYQTFETQILAREVNDAKDENDTEGEESRPSE